MSDGTQRTNFESLYDAVIAIIQSGQFRPGDRISIKDLSLRLKVSPTPLREVLSRLVGRQVIEERRAEGYYLPRIDARDVGDLYRLHLSCIERALRAQPPLDVHRLAVDAADIWDVFAIIVSRTGDRILADMQHYLADRLAVLRRCEAHLFAASLHDRHLRSAIPAAETVVALRRHVRAFHRLRWKAAQELLLLLGRP